MNLTDKRNLSILTVGRLVSLIGSEVQSIAIPLYILEITSSATLMGLFAIACILPSVIVAPVAGVISDRYSRKNLMVITDIVRGLFVLILAYLFHINQFSMVLLFILQILISSMDSIFASSTFAIYSDLFEEKDLTRMVAIRSITSNVGRIVGPLLGGILYAAYGIGVIFIINTLSFIVSGLLELLIVYKKAEPVAESSKLNIIKGMVEVFSYIKSSKALYSLLIFVIVLNFFDTPFYSVGYPYMFDTIAKFSSQQYGFLMSCLMAGMLIGNSLLAVFTSKLDNNRILSIALLIEFSSLIAISSLSIPAAAAFFIDKTFLYLLVFALFIIITGTFYAIETTLFMTKMQKAVPNELTGRFYSFIHVVIEGTTPVSLMIFGVFLDIIPPHFVFITFSVSLLMTSLVYIRNTKEIYKQNLESKSIA